MNIEISSLFGEEEILAMLAGLARRYTDINDKKEKEQLRIAMHNILVQIPEYKLTTRHTPYIELAKND